MLAKIINCSFVSFMNKMWALVNVIATILMWVNIKAITYMSTSTKYWTED